MSLEAPLLLENAVRRRLITDLRNRRIRMKTQGLPRVDGAD
jgi:hypothetical protein